VYDANSITDETCKGVSYDELLEEYTRLEKG
jgi:hypothetical protein